MKDMLAVNGERGSVLFGDQVDQQYAALGAELLRKLYRSESPCAPPLITRTCNGRTSRSVNALHWPSSMSQDQVCAASVVLC